MQNSIVGAVVAFTAVLAVFAPLSVAAPLDLSLDPRNRISVTHDYETGETTVTRHQVENALSFIFNELASQVHVDADVSADTKLNKVLKRKRKRSKAKEDIDPPVLTEQQKTACKDNRIYNELKREPHKSWYCKFKDYIVTSACLAYQEMSPKTFGPLAPIYKERMKEFAGTEYGYHSLLLVGLNPKAEVDGYYASKNGAKKEASPSSPTDKSPPSGGPPSTEPVKKPSAEPSGTPSIVPSTPEVPVDKDLQAELEIGKDTPFAIVGMPGEPQASACALKDRLFVTKKRGLEDADCPYRLSVNTQVIRIDKYNVLEFNGPKFDEYDYQEVEKDEPIIPEVIDPGTKQPKTQKVKKKEKLNRFPMAQVEFMLAPGKQVTFEQFIDKGLNKMLEFLNTGKPGRFTREKLITHYDVFENNCQTAAAMLLNANRDAMKKKTLSLYGNFKVMDERFKLGLQQDPATKDLFELLKTEKITDDQINTLLTKMVQQSSNAVGPLEKPALQVITSLYASWEEYMLHGPPVKDTVKAASVSICKFVVASGKFLLEGLAMNKDLVAMCMIDAGVRYFMHG